jgi:hypothetical protein
VERDGRRREARRQAIDPSDVSCGFDARRWHDSLTNHERNTDMSEKTRVVIIGNDGYGLYYGRITATDEEIARNKAVRVYRCRHIAHWKGDPGGITSLAATGPHRGSRIGKECPSALVTGVKNVFECSADAVGRFDDMPASA